MDDIDWDSDVTFYENAEEHIVEAENLEDNENGSTTHELSSLPIPVMASTPVHSEGENRARSPFLYESDDDDDEMLSVTSSDFDDDDDIASARPRGPLAREIMTNFEEPRNAERNALHREQVTAAAAAAASDAPGIDDGEASQPLERLPLASFYTRRIPENERFYHRIDGNRMSYHRFDELGLFDRRVNEGKRN